MNLSMRGARIILPCRDVKKGYEVAGDIKSETQGIIEVEECDLASIPSIKRFCAKVLETESRVNSLIYCAGVENTPQWTTPEGFNYQLTVNYLSQYLMTFLLLPVIKHSAPGSRIINVSCHSHREATLNLSTLFTEMENYSTRCQTALSKLCVVLHSAELGRRLDGTGVTVYCANPGPCNTKIVINQVLATLKL
ncbi:retinol dehydrogenase 13 [Eurytemora carolleeae]|uniref:retinol dehydrogenase 13 n=1 Tax=Eurytemora carolleeae TaxID=1294199 RepID=UPI000C795325|nr:retinol dehydrogenase 13 [Eurytemora carolleeae]|eukprot:XP_023336097.1 retinol dehydrogenase 13-like [Eurytemora affinis]